MRTLASFLVALQLIALGPLFVLYGQIDPCRALAKEIAVRAEAAGGLGTTIEDALGDLEVNARKDIADHSTTECVGQLFANWTDRATEEVGVKEEK
jgi:hypothetical protein